MMKLNTFAAREHLGFFFWVKSFPRFLSLCLDDYIEVYGVATISRLL